MGKLRGGAIGRKGGQRKKGEGRKEGKGEIRHTNVLPAPLRGNTDTFAFAPLCAVAERGDTLAR